MDRSEQLIRAYGKPHNSRGNPHGNPFGITLEDDFLDKRLAETDDEYRRRIANKITTIRYPRLRA